VSAPRPLLLEMVVQSDNFDTPLLLVSKQLDSGSSLLNFVRTVAVLASSSQCEVHCELDAN